jgi:hypothetical protein
MAPPLSDTARLTKLASVHDDLGQHDDSSLATLDLMDDDSLHAHETTYASSTPTSLNLGGSDDEHEFELSRDIGELLYGDDSYNADDDDEDLLSFYLRKREAGFKAMAGYQNSHGDDSIEGSFTAHEDPDNTVDDGSVQNNNEQDDQTASHDDLIEDNGEVNEEDKDGIWSHRPKQNRTGVLWEGWPDAAFVSSEGNWWRKSRQCFEVDNICHKIKTNTWFYYQPQSEKLKKSPFQPSMELRCEPLRYDRGLVANERVNITIDAASMLENVTFVDGHTFKFSASSNIQGGQCKISSIPIHMTLQSMFNYMIGEFYARTLLPLHRLMMSATPSSSNVNDDGSQKPWEQDIQFYVHLSHGDQTLYDGHKLLLSGMLSKENSAEVKSMASLFTNESSESGEEDDCKCYEKMVFCGYAVHTEESTDGETSPNNDTINREDSTPSDLTPDINTKYTLWGSSNTADDIDGRGYCGKGEIAMDLYSCDEWADLRFFLISNFINHYPTLKQDVVSFRRDALIKLKHVDDSYNGDTKEWKFVGLAQRSYRRSWINLPEVANVCNSLYQTDSGTKVACVEVNVEKTNTPYEQLILHQSVDALIGVHGAQLTQAVLLPHHAHILELLPWVTDYIRGSWVQTRHTPTPLGIIFHNTDLNHVGYSLDRDSVPMCKVSGELGSEEEKECFISKANRMKFIWENRDFEVDPTIIMQYIHQRILAQDNECSVISNALDAGFVQYNVWCKTEGASDDKKSPIDPTLKLRHYYDSKAKKKNKT